MWWQLFTGRVVKVHVKPHQGVNIGAPARNDSDGPLKLRLNILHAGCASQRGTPFEVDINETAALISQGDFDQRP